MDTPPAVGVSGAGLLSFPAHGLFQTLFGPLVKSLVGVAEMEFVLETFERISFVTL